MNFDVQREANQLFRLANQVFDQPSRESREAATRLLLQETQSMTDEQLRAMANISYRRRMSILDQEDPLESELMRRQVCVNTSAKKHEYPARCKDPGEIKSQIDGVKREESQVPILEFIEDTAHHIVGVNFFRADQFEVFIPCRQPLTKVPRKHL